jgi:hypothetical protein
MGETGGAVSALAADKQSYHCTIEISPYSSVLVRSRVGSTNIEDQLADIYYTGQILYVCVITLG